MWFDYYQNNSGGHLIGPASLVVIEAKSPEEANARAELHGVYYDPECEIDCPCCGSRWYESYSEESGEKFPHYHSREIDTSDPVTEPDYPDEEFFELHAYIVPVLDSPFYVKIRETRYGELINIKRD